MKYVLVRYDQFYLSPSSVFEWLPESEVSDPSRLSDVLKLKSIASSLEVFLRLFWLSLSASFSFFLFELVGSGLTRRLTKWFIFSIPVLYCKMGAWGFTELVRSRGELIAFGDFEFRVFRSVKEGRCSTTPPPPPIRAIPALIKTSITTYYDLNPFPDITIPLNVSRSQKNSFFCTHPVTRARQWAGWPGLEIFDPEKNFILNPEPCQKPDFQILDPESGPEKPGPLPSPARNSLFAG